MTMDRYAHLESHSDVGLGADEDGLRRFTRPCERAELRARSKKAETRDTQILGGTGVTGLITHEEQGSI